MTLAVHDQHYLQVTVLKSVGAGEIAVPKGQVPHDVGWRAVACYGAVGVSPRLKSTLSWGWGHGNNIHMRNFYLILVQLSIVEVEPTFLFWCFLVWAIQISRLDMF